MIDLGHLTATGTSGPQRRDLGPNFDQQLDDEDLRPLADLDRGQRIIDMAHHADRSVTFTAFVGRPVQEVTELLRSDASLVIAGARDHDADKVAVNLDVPLGKQGAVSRPASVALGVPGWDGERFRLAVTVAALEKQEWFPTFRGSLEADEVGIGDTRLRLSGAYDLPLGALGRASGRAGGDKLARASLYSLFVAIVTTVDRELSRRSPAWRPASAPELLRQEDDHPLGT